MNILPPSKLAVQVKKDCKKVSPIILRSGLFFWDISSGELDVLFKCNNSKDKGIIGGIILHWQLFSSTLDWSDSKVVTFEEKLNTLGLEILNTQEEIAKLVSVIQCKNIHWRNITLDVFDTKSSLRVRSWSKDVHFLKGLQPNEVDPTLQFAFEVTSNGPNILPSESRSHFVNIPGVSSALSTYKRNEYHSCFSGEKYCHENSISAAIDSLETKFGSFLSLNDGDQLILSILEPSALQNAEYIKQVTSAQAVGLMKQH